VCVIQYVEGLSAKLQAHAFTEMKVLGHREINTRRWWSIDNSTARCSWNIGYRCPYGRIGLETRGVEPLLKSVWCVGVRITEQVWPVAGDCRRIISKTRSIKARSGNREGQPGVVRHDT